MKEEYVNAVQNIGAAMIIIGTFGCTGAMNIFTLLLCVVVICIGFLLIAKAESTVKKLEQKNKCHRTAKHYDTY